jgi:hypothetical protein
LVAGVAGAAGALSMMRVPQRDARNRAARAAAGSSPSTLQGPSVGVSIEMRSRLTRFFRSIHVQLRSRGRLQSPSES